MESLLSLVIIVLVLASVLLLVLGKSPAKVAARGLAGRTTPSKGSGFATALVATAALSTALGPVLPNASNAATIGALAGIVGALLSAKFLTVPRVILYNLLGVAGILAVFIRTISDPNECSGGALGTWYTVLIGALCIFAGFAGWATGHAASTPLATFGAFSVVKFIASPLGVPAFTTTSPALMTTVGIVAALLFGFMAGKYPGPVIGLSTLAITLTTIAVAALIIPTCGPADPGPQAFVLLAAFCATFALTSGGKKSSPVSD